MKKVIFSICICLGFNDIANSQHLVDVLATQNKFIQMAASLSRNIPAIGPFLSPIASVLFGVKEDPGYDEIKLEWQGYTNQKITELRKNNLLALLEGIKNQIKEINTLEIAILNNPRLTVEFENKKRFIWEAIITNMDQDIFLFKSYPLEPAASLLTSFSIAANLHINAYDQLILLNKYTEPTKRDADRYLRSEKCKKLNKLLEEEIYKAAEERGQLIQAEIVEIKRRIPIGTNNDKKGTQVFRNEVEYKYQVTDNGIPVEETVYRSVFGDRRAKMDSDKVKIYKDVKNKFINNAKKHYLIPETTVLKIQLLNTNVTSGILLEMFSLLNPFSTGGIKEGVDSGFIKYWGLVYEKNNQYIVVGKLPDHTSYDIRVGEWKSAQYGYVEMETAFALEAKTFWESNTGKRIINGERSMRVDNNDKFMLKDPAYNHLIIDIDHLFDPWGWKWKFDL